jgi:hypothetical protein
VFHHDTVEYGSLTPQLIMPRCTNSSLQLHLPKVDAKQRVWQTHYLIYSGARVQKPIKCGVVVFATAGVLAVLITPALDELPCVGKHSVHHTPPFTTILPFLTVCSAFALVSAQHRAGIAAVHGHTFFQLYACLLNSYPSYKVVGVERGFEIQAATYLGLFPPMFCAIQWAANSGKSHPVGSIL